MNIIKPIYVYKWVNHTKYTTFVFDPSDSKGIQEPIYQDSSKEDAMNKIAYYLNADKTPYYAWVNDEPFLYTLGSIKWKGYHVNPFKSTDRESPDINEDNHKNYNKAKELFETSDVINIVFKSDFNYENPYYYDDVRFKSNTYNTTRDSKVGELYRLNLNIANNKKTSEEYYKVVFEARMTDVPSLIIVFDKLSSSSKAPLIQYITSLNKAYYKLFKKHTFKNRRELSRIFKLNNDGKECIHINSRILFLTTR